MKGLALDKGDVYLFEQSLERDSRKRKAASLYYADKGGFHSRVLSRPPYQPYAR